MRGMMITSYTLMEICIKSDDVDDEKENIYDNKLVTKKKKK